MSVLVEGPGGRDIENRKLFRAYPGLSVGDLVPGLMLLAFVPLALWARTRDVLPGDLRFTRWVQGLDVPMLASLTDATNWSMSGLPLTIIGALAATLLVVLGRQLDALVLAVLLMLRLVNGVLKRLIESPRPSGELVHVTNEASGFGFPSGHASGALLLVGAIAWILTRNEERLPVRFLIWTLAISWIAMTGLGRVRSGVHWPTDVLGAWLWSLPILVLATRLAGRVEHSRSQGFGQRRNPD
jgi:undecaprenyl-diphosphatase